jgi:Protein of unknown function (DUF2971)
MAMSELLYHFTSAKFAFEDIEKRRLKVAQFSDLNDPFELRCVQLSTREQEIAFDLYKAKVAEKFGILSFSRRWDRILLWSHYADRHRGVCLGFEVSSLETKFGEVRYGADKIPYPAKLDVDFMWQALRTKYHGWRYEEEWRVFIELNNPEWNQSAGRSLYFANFSNELILREVILGAENKNTVDELREICEGYPEPFTVSRIRLCAEKFRLRRETI